ncbi:MAG: 50S ribosomal protein L22 [Nitrospirae bacterium]|nr:MAG: 50S ribosomal protein L22 [Nitrospirota bacterium]
MPEAMAKLRYVRMSPRKTRVVVDLIRGCAVNEALARLKFTPRAGARVVEKLLMSAVANAQQGGKELGDADELRVSRAFVDCGPTMKRFQPRAQGRAFTIHKRMSHITVAVSPLETKVRGKAASSPAKSKGPEKTKLGSPRPAAEQTPASVKPAKATKKAKDS